MSRSSLLPLLVAAWALAGCPDDAADPSDTGGGDTVADSAGDTSADTSADVGDTSEPADTADTADDVADTADVADTTGGDGDATPGETTTAAVAGARCALADRIGTVEISANPGSPSVRYVTALIFDSADPWYGPPELTSEVCDFHRFQDTCPACGEDELCGIGGVCMAAPMLRADVGVTLADGADTQDFVPTASDGFIAAEIMLTGAALTTELTFADQRVTLAPTVVPDELPDAAGVLEGDYDHPTGLDLTWTAPAATGSDVFTRIPINHHVGGPTFTECTAPASGGALHVDEAMLVPLAVSTGLEFQGIEHTRFAAAETPLGCVEIRYTVLQYLSLF